MPRHAFLSSTKQQLFYRTGWFARTIVCICQVVGPRHVLVGRKGGEGGVWYCTRSVHAHTHTHTVRRAYRDIRDDSFRCGSSPGSGLASRSFFFLPISVRYVCRHYIHWNISNRARLHYWHNTCVCVCVTDRLKSINRRAHCFFCWRHKKKSSSSSSFRQVDLNLSYSCRDTRRDRDRVELVEATTCESPASNKVSAPSKHSSRSIARIQRKSTIDVSVAI